MSSSTQVRQRTSVLAVGSMLAAMLLGCPTSALAEGVCPNEQLRAENHSTSLPDCRAYELVTPPFKFGQFPYGDVVAGDGSGLLFESLGAFDEAGDNSDPGGPTYLAARGGTGWSSQSLETSATELQNPEASESHRDASQNLSETVLERTPISAKAIDKRLYVRRPGGELAEVGRELPPAAVAAWTGPGEKGDIPTAAYEGASSDLSHVFFRSRREGTLTDFLWPGDTIAAFFSVYEYAATGVPEPRLVGVKNIRSLEEEGALQHKAHINEAAELISQCGTALGAPDKEDYPIDTYNAISTDGSNVFFTATQGGCAGHTPAGENTIGKGPLVNELYVRINGSHTVSISEPSKEDCSACNTQEAEEPSLTQAQAQALKATFQGASRDGSKVFFLSKQKLLAGSEGVNLYEFDFNASEPHRKVTLLAARMSESAEALGLIGVPQGGVMRVSEDGTSVYFVSEEGEELASNSDSIGQKAKLGSDNLYVYNTVSKRYMFIAELAAGDNADWSVGDASRSADATPDGRFLLFASNNHLTPDASGQGEQLYRYDAQSGELIRVSIGENGINDNGNSAGFSHIVTAPYSKTALARPPALSITDDGSKVFFTSPWALAPGALNAVCVLGHEVEGVCEAETLLAENVYEYENGHVYLLSDGKDRNGVISNPAVQLVGTSPSGRDVFFHTADPLVPSDIDSSQDVYDARVGGGFPAPVAPVGCEEGCQGPLGTAPAFGAPGSATLSGSGNFAATSTTTPPVGAKSKVATRAQMLAGALKACRAKHNRRKRAVCASQARKRYGSPHTGKKSNRRGM